MKSEKLIDALGKIDDRLVTEIVPGMPIRKKQHWPTILATAAMVGVCLLGYLGSERFSLPEKTANPMEQSEERPGVEEHVTEPEIMDNPEVDWDALKEEILYRMRKGGASTEIQNAMLRHLETECVDMLPEWQNRLWWYGENDPYLPTELPSLYCYEYSTKDDEYRMDYFFYADGQVQRGPAYCIAQAEVKANIMSAPAPDEISEAIKQRYVDQLLDNYDPTKFVYWGWDCVFEILNLDEDEPQPYLFFTDQQGSKIVTVARAINGYKTAKFVSDSSKLEEYEEWLNTLPGAGALSDDVKSTFAMYLVTHPHVEANLEQCDDIYVDTVLIDWIERPRLNLRCMEPYSYKAYIFNGDQIVEETGSYSAEQYWTDFTDRFHREHYFAGVDRVGAEARNAAQRFFQENPEWLDAFIGGHWSWRIADVQGRRAAVLDCEAPILKHLGESQTFWYFYDDGTFEIGPSGYWPGDWGDDLKLMAVCALQADEPHRLQRLREVYARYNYENPETLQYVTSANEGDPVYESEDEVIYYRLISAEVVNEEQQIYELQFEGLSVCTDDLNRSENWNAAQYNYSWGLLYQDAAEEAVVQAMASEESYKDQNLSVSQRLTVHVQITAESNPFEPLAAIREKQ